MSGINKQQLQQEPLRVQDQQNMNIQQKEQNNYDIQNQKLFNQQNISNKFDINYFNEKTTTDPSTIGNSQDMYQLNEQSQQTTTDWSNLQYQQYKLQNSSSTDKSNQKQDMSQTEEIQKPRRAYIQPNVRLKPSDFRLLKQIGQGAYSSVYLVQKIDGPLYAMKVLTKNMYAREKQFNRLKDEILIMRSLKSYQNMKLSYVFQSKTKMYLIMKFVAGGDLHKQQQNWRRLTVDQITQITSEILYGMKELHENDIIYRDLKPENVLLDENGHAILSDFGLSLIDHRMHQNPKYRSNQFCGTPEFMAPEVLLQIPYTKAIDVWSFGCLLYEITTGTGVRTIVQQFKKKSLFTNCTFKNIIFFPKYVDKNIQDVVIACLQVRQKDRPTIQQLMEMPAYQSIDWSKFQQKPQGSQLNMQIQENVKYMLEEDIALEEKDIKSENLQKVLVNFPKELTDKYVILPNSQLTQKVVEYQDKFKELCFP